MRTMFGGCDAREAARGCADTSDGQARTSSQQTIRTARDVPDILASCFIRGASPLGLPYWRSRGRPGPRSARQARSLSLARSRVYDVASSLDAIS